MMDEIHTGIDAAPFEFTQNRRHGHALPRRVAIALCHVPKVPEAATATGTGFGTTEGKAEVAGMPVIRRTAG